MTLSTSANAYLRTKVLSASPAELRLMLLDGSIKFALQAQAGIEAGDCERAFAGFTQCRDIILELIRTIDDKHDPELAERVRSLYTFLYTELVAASHERNTAKLGKVVELLEYERETWALLMAQLAEEAGSPGAGPAANGATNAAASGTPAAAARPAASPAERAPLSLQA